MKYLIKQILREEVKKSKTQYQVRDIGGPIYYKKEKGDKYWHIIDESEYFKYSNRNNRVKWVNKFENKSKSGDTIKKTINITTKQMEMLKKDGTCDCGEYILKLKTEKK